MGDIDSLDDLAADVAAHLPALIRRIPTTPAAVLGGLAPEPALTGVTDALRWLGPLLAERLLGALELHLDDLPAGAHGLAAGVTPGSGHVATVHGGHESEAVIAAGLLDATHPGATALITDLVARLTRHPALAGLLSAPDLPPAPPGAAPPAQATPAAAPRPTGRPPTMPPTPSPVGFAVPVRQVHPLVDDAAARAAAEANLRAHARRAREGTPANAQVRPARPSPARVPTPLPPTLTTPEARAEAAVAAAHAAPHLALAVITAHAVLTELGAATPAAVVGTALGATALHLPTLPKPAAHTAAVLARRRAEYLLPVMTSGFAEVRDHHFTLAEGPTPDTADFSANGLVTVVENGIAVRTAADRHGVPVTLKVLTGPPDDDFEYWDDVVEVGWHTHHGDANTSGRGLPIGTPPWPGDFRVRVHARGRDGHDQEWYEIALWEAPPAPERVLKRPDPAEPPYAAHRWVQRSSLGEAATVTVVTGATADHVLRAFGATGETASLRERAWDVEPSVAIREVDGAVIAVEHNGYQGTVRDKLAALSEHGRAASMFWTADALTQLSFAERGRVLASFEPWALHDVPRPVLDLLTDLTGGARHKEARGLTAVARFTGRGITPEDLAAIEEADVVHLIG